MRRGQGDEMLRQSILRVAGLLGMLFTSVNTTSADMNSLAIVNRTIVQDRGDWQIDYRLRHDGASGLIVTAEEVWCGRGLGVELAAAGHATPRWSFMTNFGTVAVTGRSEVIASDDEERRCRERRSVRFWAEDRAGKPRRPGARESGRREMVPEATPPAVLSLAPGSSAPRPARLEHPARRLRRLRPSARPPDGRAPAGDRPRSGRLAARPGAAGCRAGRRAPVRGTRGASRYPVLSRRRRTASTWPLTSPAAPTSGSRRSRSVTTPRCGFGSRTWLPPGPRGRCRARITQFKDSPVAWKVLHRRPAPASPDRRRPLDAGRGGLPHRARRRPHSPSTSGSMGTTSRSASSGSTTSSLEPGRPRARSLQRRDHFWFRASRPTALASPPARGSRGPALGQAALARLTLLSTASAEPVAPDPGRRRPDIVGHAVRGGRERVRIPRGADQAEGALP